ncbi:hypothetical protein F5Y18DRAFT_386676 [Xylariaceae sp. FL1019]|nr:hypothetical protein F5Y18DRAFT_386676 [Xylariaceae sp. FL1019]
MSQCPLFYLLIVSKGMAEYIVTNVSSPCKYMPLFKLPNPIHPIREVKVIGGYQHCGVVSGSPMAHCCLPLTSVPPRPVSL